MSWVTVWRVPPPTNKTISVRFGSSVCFAYKHALLRDTWFMLVPGGAEEEIAAPSLWWKKDFPVPVLAEPTSSIKTSGQTGECGRNDGEAREVTRNKQDAATLKARRRGNHYFVDAVCKNCGQHYGARKDDVKLGRTKFCSKSCHASIMAHETMGISKQIQNIAYREVHKALRSGALIKLPCEICGESKVDAHHEDYSKPLDVKWLCPSCHVARHMPCEVNRGGENNLSGEVGSRHLSEQAMSLKGQWIATSRQQVVGGSSDPPAQNLQTKMRRSKRPQQLRLL